MDVTSMVVTKDIETEELTDNTDTPPAIREGQSLKRWSIYFNSKKYRSYSVRTSCSSTTAIQQPKRMSDCIGLQNLKVKKVLLLQLSLSCFIWIPSTSCYNLLSSENSLEVCLTCSRLPSGIPIQAWLKNLRCSIYISKIIITSFHILYGQALTTNS